LENEYVVMLAKKKKENKNKTTTENGTRETGGYKQLERAE
jgi:hypothetical protein